MAEVCQIESADCSSKFEQIVKRLASSRSALVPCSPCPDQMVGKISFFKNKKMCDFMSRETIDYGALSPMSPAVRVVLIILESPHINEFDNGNPIGPACGCTGCRIRKYFSQIFGGAYDDCALVLLNTFRFQCSLGLSDVNLKNRVIRACERDSAFEDDLYGRISEVKKRFLVQLFVNASGCVCEGFVDKVLRELRVDKKIVKRIKHPSRWNENTRCKEI